MTDAFTPMLLAVNNFVRELSKVKGVLQVLPLVGIPIQNDNGVTTTGGRAGSIYLRYYPADRECTGEQTLGGLTACLMAQLRALGYQVSFRGVKVDTTEGFAETSLQVEYATPAT